MIDRENPGGWRDLPRRRLETSRTLSVAAAGLAALWLAGCSMTFPLKSLLPDDATGSTPAKPSPISAELNAADWRIAKPKLVQALKSDGDQATAWSNPDSGRSGAFEPVAGPFDREGRACRAFVARLELPDHESTIQGVGCLLASGDDVLVDQVRPWAAL